ncbi:MAG: NAD(P)H-binding protein [Caldilinea sp.]|jgi:uncharacterized protein YbjT (DUF2867 family)
MQTPILVIGATGNIGRVLIPRLTQQGRLVRAATRSPERYPAHPGVTPIYFDYEQPDSFAPAVAGIKQVFAIAGPASTGVTLPFSPFVAQMQQAGVEHLVLVTTMPILRSDGPHLWEEVEQPVLQAGVPCTFLRPNWFMQAFVDSFMATMAQQGRLCVPAADARISLIDARDIGEAAATVLTTEEHRAHAYTLTGGEALNFAEIAATIAHACDRPVQYHHEPLETLGETAINAAGGTVTSLKNLNYLFKTLRQGSFATVDPTIEKLIGRPPTTFAHFADEHAAVWKTEPSPQLTRSA